VLLHLLREQLAAWTIAEEVILISGEAFFALISFHTGKVIVRLVVFTRPGLNLLKVLGGCISCNCSLHLLNNPPFPRHSPRKADDDDAVWSLA
jgi:hypothetical protein